MAELGPFLTFFSSFVWGIVLIGTENSTFVLSSLGILLCVKFNVEAEQDFKKESVTFAC